MTGAAGTQSVATRPNREPLIELTDATKTYRGVHALDDVSFTLFAGEVHALVGENGAGKSTLCKILSGAIELSSGSLAVDGKEVHFALPQDALSAGIAMVYQETSLVPTMTVAQNIVLGAEPRFTRYRTLNNAAQQLLQSMNFQVDPSAYVSTLGTAKKQMVEIAKAISTNSRVIIFDEPSSSLTPEETIHLFNAIAGLRSRGIGIIYVSHALEESLVIADRITVLRDGKYVSTSPAKELTREMLVMQMVGRDLSMLERRTTKEGQPRIEDGFNQPVLQVQNVTCGTIVKNMSFSAYAGEIVGMAGLIGAGRTEIARIISGSLKRNRVHGGTILLHGRPIRYRVPRQAIADGIAYITEDRKIDGFFETMSISQNIYLGRLGIPRRMYAAVPRKKELRVAEDMIRKLEIRAINSNASVVEVSGGNQQKVVIAKSLVQEPSLIIFDEPTRGVDVGAIHEIHQIIRDLADAGNAVIVISSYLPEILSLSDRILVARLGRIAAEFDASKVTEHDLMYAAVY